MIKITSKFEFIGDIGERIDNYDSEKDERRKKKDKRYTEDSITV